MVNLLYIKLAGCSPTFLDLELEEVMVMTTAANVPS